MRRILVGYDGSEAARHALERAAELAEDGATVAVVSAVHPVYGKGGVTHDPVEVEAHDQNLREAKARLQELGIEAKTHEGFGDPAKVIAQEAEEMDADLIVVGSENRNLLERILLGSVSADVIRRTKADVLVVH